MFIGIVLIGFAIAILRISQFGTDPFSCMNLGLSSALNLGFGTYQLIVNIILFAFVLWKGRHFIGIGTIINMAGVGYISDFCVFVLTKFLGNTELLSMQVRIILLIFAVFVYSFSAAMYMEADLGIAPYDALGVVIEKMSNGKIPFKVIRVVIDVLCVVIGFSFGSIVGVATVIIAFCMGPLIELFRNQCMKKLIVRYSN